MKLTEKDLDRAFDKAGSDFDSAMDSAWEKRQAEQKLAHEIYEKADKEFYKAQDKEFIKRDHAWEEWKKSKELLKTGENHGKS